MEQNVPLEAYSRSADQEIPHLSCNPKIHYCVHNAPPAAGTCNDPSLVHSLTPYFLKVHFNVDFTPMHNSPKRYPRLRFYDQNFLHVSYIHYTL